MSKLKAVIDGSCPRCHKGDIFKAPATNLTKFYQMHKKCPKCNLAYEREPGFFIGAMYVNYAFSVALIISIGVLLSIFDIYNIYTFMGATSGIILLLLPFLFRYSRIIYLHMFGGVNFEPDYLKHP